MRFHWVWTDDGKWVRPPKPQEIPGVGEESSTPEHSNPVIDTSTCKKLNTPALETVKSKNFRKQNPVISSTPEESQATFVAMKSACDLGGNLASKGKNPRSNQEEAGLKTRVAKTSKKRPRQPNAHITNQQVLAAAEVKKGNYDQAEGEIVRNEDLPFKKNSYMWKEIDSLEVFKMLPQNPHFSPMKDCNEFFRQGTAIGHMRTFASLVGKVSELQIEDSRSLFESYLEALAMLETVGFNVKVVVDRVNELLAFKTKQEHLKEMFNVKAGAPW